MKGLRKTIKIRDLILEVNRRNRESTCSAEVRRGWNTLLADILCDNNVYAGYGYVEPRPTGDYYPGDWPKDPSRQTFYLDVHLQESATVG